MDAQTKMSKMAQIIDIVCAELGVSQFFRNIAIGEMAMRPDVCIRTFDRVMKVLR